MASSLSPPDPGHAMAGVVDTARGWLRLLAVRQIPELLKMVGQKVVRLATVRAGDDPATSSTR